jgi:hypothetical protein
MLESAGPFFRDRQTLSMEAIIQRWESTWIPQVENWSDELWQEVAVFATREWRCMQGPIRIRMLQDRLLDLIDDLKRISHPVELLPTHRTSYKFSLEANWRLLCFSVGIQPYNSRPNGAFANIVGTEVIAYWLNRSPLFSDHPITLSEVGAVIGILDLMLGDPSSNQRERRLEIQAPQKRPSSESLRSNSTKKRQAASRSGQIISAEYEEDVAPAAPSLTALTPDLSDT